MSLVEGEIELVGAPGRAGESREGKAIELLMITDDPRGSFEAVEAFAAPDTAVVPNYYVDQTGYVRQFVADERAGNGLELAVYKRRRRNIDRVSLSISLELPPGAIYGDAQVIALHRLVERLREAHGLPPESVAAILPDARGVLRVTPIALPPPPPVIEEGGLLGSAPDSPDQALWGWLFGETWGARAAGTAANTAFAFFAAQQKLGAPMAPHGKTSLVTVGGRTFYYQAFARDILYYEGKEWSAIQSLAKLIAAANDVGDLADALLKAAYDASTGATRARTGAALAGVAAYRPDWRFHVVAATSGLGPAVSGNYAFAADQKYPFQVFAGDTIYTPPNEQSGFYQLGLTEPSHPAYNALWAETYKYAGAAYDPNSPFQQRAVRDRLGVPLTGVYDKSFNGAGYKVQVFSLDTLFAGPDGQVRRMSELPLTGQIAGWKPGVPKVAPPAPAPKPAPSTGAVAVPAFRPVPNDPNWPPKPAFWSITREDVRERLFGRIDWVRKPRAGEPRAIEIRNNWAAENIIDVEVPQLRRFVSSGKVKFHRVAAEGFRRFWEEVERQGYLPLVLSWSGTWVPRVMTSDYSKLSNHAYGTAFDINVPENGWQKRPALVGQRGSVRELVPIANACGFFWGGHWDARWWDGMHFEWAVVK
jgi:hypothetical protein